MPSPSPSLDAIFCEAIEIRAPEARSAYITEACGEDETLRRQVESLVEAHFRAGSFLDQPAGPAAATAGWVGAEAPGTLIGPYKLLEQIGEGGMGVVFVAEQTEPVRRRVALKVIKPGMDTREVVARFEAERQAVALMDHPNIARVFDAGANDRGRPYFVMELVRGLPITDYCDRVGLSPRDRLRLFVQVCRAVQHAHMKGVIHRDLKPSNVLVTLHDGTPVPKVIDFGVAKAVGQRLTDRSLYTRFVQMVGTPLYMAPEQAELSGLDIDTRADVYTLGVLLYELLTGTTPFDPETLRKAGLDEVRRIIREQEPPRPSQRVSTLGAEERSTVSARRGLDMRQLTRLLRGDLDWVAMKALEKDRDRRYESVGAFAADVERYLADEPVEARPASGWYRLRKITRRNRAALLTAGLVAAALVAGTVVSVWQAIEANGARRLADERLGDERQATAQAQASFGKALEAVDRMMGDVSDLKVASPQLHELRRRLMADSVALYTELAVLNPRAEVYVRRGQVLVNLGKLDRARGDFERAIELDPGNADAHLYLGWMLIYYGAGLGVANRGEVGLSHMQRAVELQPTNPRLHDELGWAYLIRGRPESAVAPIRRAADLCGQSPEARFFYQAEAEFVVGNLRAAITNYEQCLAHAPADPWGSRYAGWAHHHIVRCLFDLGEAERALAAFEKAAEVPGYPIDLRGWIYVVRGDYYLAQGRYEDALSDYNNAAEFYPAQTGAYKPRAWLHFRSGRYPQALADVAKAVEYRPDDLSALTGRISPEAVASCPDEGFRRGILGLADRTIERLRGLPEEASAYVARAQLHAAMGEAAKAADDWARATASYHRWLAEQQKKPSRDDTMMELAYHQAELGHSFLDGKRYAEAEPILRECLATREKLIPDKWRRFNAMSMLGSALLGQAKYTEAEPLLLQGYEGMAQRKDSFPARLPEAVERIVKLYEATGRPEKAREWRAKLPPELAPPPRVVNPKRS